jgi:RNA polymerase sigma-70 factor (ECF subfamily)
MDAVTSSTSDARALAGAREGQEAAFLMLVDRYHCPMVHLAETFVHSRALAEEVAREAWAEVLARSSTFQGRSSVRCWMFQILVERAQFRAAHEVSSVSPSTSQARHDTPVKYPSAGTFFDDSHAVWPGWWIQSPQAWEYQQLETAAAREQALNALRSLPPVQRRVMMLRDVEGWTSAEVCETMQLSAVEQRALLHRARTAVRARLEPQFRSASR